MIQIDIMVMGASTKTLYFQEKAAAKKEYIKYMDSLSCYALVSVEGKQLTLAQTRKFFRLPAIVKYNPRKVTEEGKLPHFKWQRR